MVIAALAPAKRLFVRGFFVGASRVLLGLDLYIQRFGGHLRSSMVAALAPALRIPLLKNRLHHLFVRSVNLDQVSDLVFFLFQNHCHFGLGVGIRNEALAEGFWQPFH